MSDDGFSAEIRARCMSHWPSLVEAAATRWGMKSTEYVRSALVERLERDGFSVATSPASRSAGDLYDVLEGRQRFALIEGDTVVTMDYRAERPSIGDWRPVRHQDSEPFDIATKWRLKPVARIEADRVVVTYPVVDKAMELA